MRYSKFILLLIIFHTSVSSVLADEKRQHGVHEHGGGQLNIAVEKNALMIELSLPAMNVVGFEHPANNEKEQAQVNQALEKLRDGQAIMVPSTAARCELKQVEVETALLDEHEHKHKSEEESHADFDVMYKFNCSQPSALKSLSLTLFKQFPGTQHLDVQVITASGQTGVELSTDSPVLRLN